MHRLPGHVVSLLIFFDSGTSSPCSLAVVAVHAMGKQGQKRKSGQTPNDPSSKAVKPALAAGSKPFKDAWIAEVTAWCLVCFKGLGMQLPT